MAVNAVPPTPAPVNAPATPGAARKTDDPTQDPGFASLLATLIAPIVVNPLLAAMPGIPGPDAGNAAPQMVAPAGQPVQGPVLPPGPVPGAQGLQAVPNGAAFDAALLAAQGQAQQAAAGDAQAQAQVLVVPVPPEPVVQADNLTQIVSDALRQAATAQAANSEPVQPVGTGKAEPGARKTAPGEPQFELPVPGISEANQAVKSGEPVPVAPVAPVVSVDSEVRTDGRHQPEIRTARPSEPSLQNVAFPATPVRAGESQIKPLEQIPTPIDPQRLMDAIAQSMSTARPGRYTVTLQLHPESLGEVRLQMQVVGREVHAAMQVTSPAAQQALEDQGDRLRQALSQSGLTLSGFNVSTGPGNQTPQDRRDQLHEQLAAQRRNGAPAPVRGPDRPTAQRLGRDRTGGVLDTLA